MSVPDVPLKHQPEQDYKAPRQDHLVRRENLNRYQAKRLKKKAGVEKRCVTCKCKLRYTRTNDYCSLCERRRSPEDAANEGKKGPKFGLMLMNLKSLRMAAGHRYASRFAALADVSPEAYRRLERCQNGAKPETAERIAQVLGVTVEDLRRSP